MGKGWCSNTYKRIGKYENMVESKCIFFGRSKEECFACSEHRNNKRNLIKAFEDMLAVMVDGKNAFSPSPKACPSLRRRAFSVYM